MSSATAWDEALPHGYEELASELCEGFGHTLSRFLGSRTYIPSPSRTGTVTASGKSTGGNNRWHHLALISLMSFMATPALSMVTSVGFVSDGKVSILMTPGWS